MKKIRTLMLLWIAALTSFAQTDSYYYYHGEKLHINLMRDKVCILLYGDSFNSTATNLKTIYDLRENLTYNIERPHLLLENKLGSPIADTTVVQLLSNRDVLSGGLLFDYDGTLAYINNQFIVKLKSVSSNDDFVKLLNDNLCEIEETFTYDSNTYLIRSQDYCCLNKANVFFESGLCDYAQPNFIYLNGFTSNDTYYNEQWGLNNTGQGGGQPDVDLNIEQAWTVTRGRNDVIVAVLDEGVDITHPDLAGNIVSPLRFCPNASFLMPVEKSHGTCCAGIIAAISDNNIGISGVAPNCKIMPVDVRQCGGSYSTQSIGTSIQSAANAGAKVISLSWGGYCPDQSIEGAINSIQNRVVVVCSSGNENYSYVSFPGSLDYSNVISVGAVDHCGARAGRIDKIPWSCDPWGADKQPGSCYGDKLWVVAPGTNILTTYAKIDNRYVPYSDNSVVDSGYCWFGATSAACPFVAGVAALMLSVNPNLYPLQVKRIIAQTAQKINYGQHYPYNSNAALGWKNDELGYGLVDAYAAVVAAGVTDLYVSDTSSDNGAEPTVVQCMWNSPAIWIEDMNGNMVTSPVGGERYNVCVRIKKRLDSNPSTGNEKLFVNWAKAGLDLPWPDAWNGSSTYSCNGQTIPLGGVIGNANGLTLPSINDSYNGKVFKMGWTVPRGEDYDCGDFENSDEKWHFCLLARVHDGNEIIGEDSIHYPIDRFVLENNNVAWKNLTILEGGKPAAVSLWNHFPSRDYFNIQFRIPQAVHESELLEHGELYVQLSPNLTTHIQNDGATVRGMEFVSDNVFRVTDANASIDSIALDGGEFGMLQTILKFYTDNPPKDSVFDFDITFNQGVSLLGGEHYTAVYDFGRTFKAVADNDIIVLPYEEVSLNATEIGEPAKYKWYGTNGDTVASGTSFNTIATQNTRYKLEVEAESDGYKSVDSVNVRLRSGRIKAVSPNPASSQVSVEYLLAPTVTGGRIQIVNMMGIVMSSTSFTFGSTMNTIDIHHLLHGHYTVRLVSSNGEILDAKSLIIQ